MAKLLYKQPGAFSATLPIYEVTSSDCTVEFTQLIGMAEIAYRNAKGSIIKMFRLNRITGMKVLVKQKHMQRHDMRVTLNNLITRSVT